jgi:transcriptional regulator with XRE-family HTH domain
MIGAIGSTDPKHLVDWRNVLNISQMELARAAGVSQKTVSLIERRIKPFSEPARTKIWDAVTRLNRERADRLTHLATTVTSNDGGMAEALSRKSLRNKSPRNEAAELQKVPKQQLIRRMLMLGRDNEGLRSQLQAYQQKETREVGPLLAEAQAAWMERNLKPVTEELAEMRRQVADLQRLMAIKTEAIVKEAQAQDLQDEIEQRVKKGK